MADLSSLGTATMAKPNPTSSASALAPVNVLMVGTGEYTTGFVHGKESNSDKSKGVVALTLFDLRSKNKTGKLALCGVNGKKFPGIRDHLKQAIEDAYVGINTEVATFPPDDQVDPKAYTKAISTFSRGDAAIIFTPDDTHCEIALACIEAGMHVLVTKPAVKTLAEHKRLHEAAVANNVLVSVEVHKRWDPIYSDARDRIQTLGHFSYLYSYMSQPKRQLDTFRSWAGKSSDISYYLNSHHIDFHEWVVGNTSRPVRVTAMASTGVATGTLGIDCEDTITLSVEWENIESEAVTDEHGVSTDCKVTVVGKGTAVYSASWIAPASDVHSQQRFFYMGHAGEVNVDQAHRGYSMATDAAGYASVNPLFMKYVPRDGRFVGQLGYGYRSVEAFVDGVRRLNAGEVQRASALSSSLALLEETYRTTAILEAGRRSLDCKGSVEILYQAQASPCMPTRLQDCPAAAAAAAAAAGGGGGGVSTAREEKEPACGKQ